MEQRLSRRRAQRIAPISVTRVNHPRWKSPMPMVLVKLQKSEREIYHLRYLQTVRVYPETLKANPGLGQCYHCQKFGHAQSMCTAPPACVRCVEGHCACDCSRPREEKVTCAKCGGDHPASYRGCSKAPRLRPMPAARSLDAPSRTERQVSSVVRPGIQYSATASAGMNNQAARDNAHTAKPPAQRNPRFESPSVLLFTIPPAHHDYFEGLIAYFNSLHATIGSVLQRINSFRPQRESLKSRK